MPDGNLPANPPPPEGGFLSKLGETLSTATFPMLRKNVEQAAAKIVGSSGDYIANLINNEIEKNTARKNVRVESIVTIGNVANKKNTSDIDIIERAAEYHSRKTLREQQSRERILQNSMEAMIEDKTQSDPNTNLDDDWLNSFANKASNVSTDKMQRLWGRLLAGEIRKPGSYSMRTIDFLSTLSIKDANLIHSFFPYMSNEDAILLPDQLKKTRFSDLVYLEELGLLSGSIGIGGLCKEYNLVGTPADRAAVPFGQIGLLIHKRLDGNQCEKIACLVCSSVMTELSRLSPTPPNNNHMKKVADEIKKRGYKVSIANLIAVGNQFTAFNEVEL